MRSWPPTAHSSQATFSSMRKASSVGRSLKRSSPKYSGDDGDDTFINGGDGAADTVDGGDGDDTADDDPLDILIDVETIV